MTEAEASLVAKGNQAGIVLEMFKPYLNEQREIIIGRLKTAFIAGNHNEHTGFVASLVALDDLERRIVKAIHAGESVVNKR
jgi:hypothetical protein